MKKKYSLFNTTFKLADDIAATMWASDHGANPVMVEILLSMALASIEHTRQLRARRGRFVHRHKNHVRRSHHIRPQHPDYTPHMRALPPESTLLARWICEQDGVTVEAGDPEVLQMVADVEPTLYYSIPKAIYRKLVNQYT